MAWVVTKSLASNWLCCPHIQDKKWSSKCHPSVICPCLKKKKMAHVLHEALIVNEKKFLNQQQNRL